MSFVKSLRCRECGREYPKQALYVCEYCFGSLEVDYDYDGIKKVLTREKIKSGPKSLWRYRDLLPIDGEPSAGFYSGFTPLVKADILARELGVKELYVKDDSVCHPTWSFKDRVVAVALSRARELGFDTVACASTGNLANSVAANAAWAGFKRYIFIPHNLEKAKVTASLVYAPNLVAVNGNYDDVNRLCAEIAGKYKWGFVNINLRAYYAEGSKTLGFEIAEQLGWRAPAHIVAPAASGSLVTKIWKALKEFDKLGLLENKLTTKIYCAQAEGCSPIATAILEASEVIKPVKPQTIAKSLAIGNPADGYYAKDVVKESGGWAAIVSDDEIREGIKLLARTEGIFTETAGGVTVASAKKLIAQGRIPKNESIVLAITGNGLKTQEAIQDFVGEPYHIEPKLDAFEEQVMSTSKNQKGTWYLWVFLFLLLLAAPLFADDEQEVNLPRDEKGVVINDTQHLKVQADRRIVRVAANVIKPEDQSEYLTRRLDQLENKSTFLETRLQSAEEKIATLEINQKKAAEKAVVSEK